MLKMSAVPKPVAKKFKARTFRSLASTTMSLNLGDSFWIVCVFIIILWKRKLIEASQNQL